MQPLSWYRYRLQAMSAGELTWRLGAALRDRLDAVRIVVGALPSPRLVDDEVERLSTPAAPELCDVARGGWQTPGGSAEEARWCERLRARADAVMAHRLPLFGVQRDLGSRIDWSRDYESNRHSVPGLAVGIDYRDYERVGDAKLVWELNRHQHLVVLARAYRATGDDRYAAAVIDQLESWLEQCPFGRGMNWRSPLELAIRLLNWIWTIDLIRDSGCLTPGMLRRLLHAAYLHLWDITRKFSRGSSANNHLIGEAAGVFVAASYLRGLPHAARWQETSFRILCREVLAQTHADGGSREQATGYHLFVFELFLVAGLAGRRLGREFPAPFWDRLERMLDFAGTLAEGGPWPPIGDADDGYVLDRGETDYLHACLALGAVLFDRRDWLAGAHAAARQAAEPVRWLCGAEGAARLASTAAPAVVPLASRACADSGYYLLQCGTRPHEAVSVVFDCGPLGLPTLAAHGHADALSLVVRAFGRDVLVDPGTFDYFTYPAWRTYFRSTRAHNTIEIDGLDQSVQLGPFLWGRHARARCLTWQPRPDGGIVEGEHVGYTRLPDPVVHRRRVELDGRQRRIVVRDELSLAAPHAVTVCFHLAPECRVVREASHQWDFDLAGHVVRATLDAQLTAELAAGRDHPIAGWVSRGYHHRQAAPTLVGRARAREGLALSCRFELDPA